MRIRFTPPAWRRGTDFDRVSGYAFVGQFYRHRAPMIVRASSPAPKKKRNRWIKPYAAGLFGIWVLAGLGILPTPYANKKEDAAAGRAAGPATAGHPSLFDPSMLGSVEQLDIARSSTAFMFARETTADDAGRFGADADVAVADAEDDTTVEDGVETGPLVVAALPETAFDRVVKDAGVSARDIAAALKRKPAFPSRTAAVAAKAKAIEAKPVVTASLYALPEAEDAGVEAADGVAADAATIEADGSTLMAFADPSPATDGGALAAVSAMAGNGVPVATIYGPDTYETIDDDSPIEAVDEELEDAPEAPEFAELPSDVARPLSRPKVDDATRALVRAKPAKPETEGTQVAFAKPNDVTKEVEPEPKRTSWFGLGRSHPKAGNGVAVYDISAATVYMPDGTKLEAHSGIGKMADNPNYVHVKMSGPTPPHTYNLRMREKRFHGVEAIRMLPVDGKNKHGRDGFLTHSYLLRGGRAESHGCVAFKDYDKFLRAFKAGKVKQLIVVPGNGKGMGKKRKDMVIEANAGGSGA